MSTVVDMLADATDGFLSGAMTVVDAPECEPFVGTVPYPAGAAAMSAGLTDPAPGLTGFGTHAEAGSPPAPVGTSA